MVCTPEIGAGQYGFSFGGEPRLFSVDGVKVDTRRPEIPPTPEDLPDPDFTQRGLVVLRDRYLLRNEKGEIIETPKELLWRVAANIAVADVFYGGDPTETAREFYLLMAKREFLPNSPTLMNAGTELQQLSACFVIPISDDDDMGAIIEAQGLMELIHSTGGGTGFNFSNLKPSGSPLSVGGFSSGPIPLIEGFFDAPTQTSKERGKKRGANMAILGVDHFDIKEFIAVKTDGRRLTNFNLSVAVTDEFMRAVEEDREYDLINPHTGERRRESAKRIFDLMVHNAHYHGDPGVVFLDTINEANPTPGLGDFESTNPCGENPLLPYESCTLGSINLAEMTEDGNIDWIKLERVIRSAVYFLDNVIDMNKLPDLKIEEATKRTRKIGLGVMGFADLLIELGVGYDSDEGVRLAEELMKFIQERAHGVSEELAQKRGSFPAWRGSIFGQQGRLMRNATVTTIAPTGSIALIADCSSGIEPLYALRYLRRDTVTPQGTWMIHPQFEKVLKRFELSEAVFEEIKSQGNLVGIEEVPEGLSRIIRTAHEISPEWHVRMQAAFQESTDNAVSKTVNLPNEATTEDIRQVFLLAWKLGCKGVTVYRAGSRREQVLSVWKEEEKSETGLVFRPRPDRLDGIMYSIGTPVGKAYINVTYNERGAPREVFVVVGKSGTEIRAMTEGFGRLISLLLATHSSEKAWDVLMLIIDQLKDIGGARPLMLLDTDQVISSLPDAIAQILKEFADEYREEG